MMIDAKTTKYQLKYLLRDLSNIDLMVSSSENGEIHIKQLHKLFDYTTVLFFIIGVGGFVFNYLESYSPLVYFLASLFLVISIGGTIMGFYRNKNNHFSFNPQNQIINYSCSLRSSPKSFKTNKENVVWCEIDEYRVSGRRAHYSVTFYKQGIAETEKRDIMVQMNSYYKYKCEAAGSALIRYLKEMSELEGLHIKEN